MNSPNPTPDDQEQQALRAMRTARFMRRTLPMIALDTAILGWLGYISWLIWTTA